MKLHRYIKPLIIFCFLVLLSPWLWIAIKNISIHQVIPVSLNPISVDHVFVTEVNNLQSQTRLAGIGIIGRIIVNKYTWWIHEFSSRYFESFDPNFIFFTGDLDPVKSTRNTGPLLLSMMPLILVGAFIYKPKILLIALFISAIPGGFISAHFESISRIPVYICLTLLATLGMNYIYRKRLSAGYFIIILMLFEWSRLLHFLLNHYQR